MRVSLKALLICVTLFAIAFCIIAYETPMSRLEKRGASFGGKTTGDLFLMGYPYQWYDYIDNNAKENRDVQVIAFPREAELKEIDFRNLGKFRNLEALSIRSKVSSEWFSHLKRCEKLRVLSYTSSAADDAAIAQMIKLESLKMINVPARNVSRKAKQKFRDSAADRIAYP